MSKAEERRAAVLERLADHILEEGLSSSSLRTLADAAGTSDRMLLYYFQDKSEIVTAALGALAERLMDILTAHAARKPLPAAKLQAALIQTVTEDTLWPYMRLWLEISALASRDDAFYREAGAQIGAMFLEWVSFQLDSSSPAKQRQEAASLLLTVEGVLLLKSVGMEETVKLALRSK